MGVGLEAAVVYQAVKAFVVIAAATAGLLAIGLVAAGKLDRRRLPMLLLPGAFVGLILGLLLTQTYDSKGAWATLYNGWVRPDRGGIMDLTDPTRQEQARRVHRASIIACASVMGLTLITLSLRNRRHQSTG